MGSCCDGGWAVCRAMCNTSGPRIMETAQRQMLTHLEAIGQDFGLQAPAHQAQDAILLDDHLSRACKAGSVSGSTCQEQQASELHAATLCKAIPHNWLPLP